MNLIRLFTPSKNYPSHWVEGQAKAFEKVKSCALKALGLTPSKVTDFDFYLYTHTASCKVDGREKTIDLKAISDKSFQIAYNEYLNISPEVRRASRDAHIFGHCKGNQHGVASLKQVTNLSIKDPRAHIVQALDNQSPEKRSVLIRRFIFIERFLEKWREELTEKVNSEEDPSKKRVYEKHLREMQSVDLYALYLALEHYPTEEDGDDKDRLASRLEQKVLKDIRSKKWIRSPTKDEREYAKDVAGLLYQDRESYLKHCSRAYGSSRLKKENICDILVREAVDFASRGAGDEEYSAEGVRNSVLFQGMSEGPKQELQNALSKMGVLLHHQIGRPEDPSVFEDGRDMNEAVQAQRNAINEELTFEDIPTPQAPSANLVSWAGTASKVVMAGASALALGHVTGWTGPSYAINQAKNYLPLSQIIGGLTFFDSFRNGMVNFIWPTRRNPEHGRVEQRLNKGRLVVALTSTAAAALMSRLMWNAVNDDVQDDSLLEQAGEQSYALMQMGANAINYLWQNSFIPIPIVSNYLEGSSYWQGYVPTILTFQVVRGVVSHIPGASYVVEPLARTAHYVSVAGNIAKAAASPVVQPVKTWTEDNIYPYYEEARDWATRKSIELVTDLTMWWNEFESLI